MMSVWIIEPALRSVENLSHKWLNLFAFDWHADMKEHHIAEFEKNVESENDSSLAVL